MDRTSRLGLAVCLALFCALYWAEETYYLPKHLPSKPQAAT